MKVRRIGVGGREVERTDLSRKRNQVIALPRELSDRSGTTGVDDADEASAGCDGVRELAITGNLLLKLEARSAHTKDADRVAACVHGRKVCTVVDERESALAGEWVGGR